MLARVRCVRRNARKICSRETSGAGAVRARAAAPAASWYTSWREESGKEEGGPFLGCVVPPREITVSRGGIPSEALLSRSQPLSGEA